MNLGTVAELHTSKRRIVPVSLVALQGNHLKEITRFFGTDISDAQKLGQNEQNINKYAFAELTFNNLDLYEKTKPIQGEKIIDKTITVIKINNFITQGNFFLRVMFDGTFYNLKCTTLTVPDSISRYGSDSYKTLIQHEVEGFLEVEKNTKINGQFAKMHAYGNMWMGNDGQQLGPVMEVILMEYIPYNSLGLEYFTALESKNYNAMYTILAEAFRNLYTLHANNVVNGNCNLNNLFRKNGTKLVWVDPSRLIERKNLKLTTWNTLKLMDIFFLLFAGYHATSTYTNDINKKNLIQFRYLMGEDKCFILPNLIYKNRLIIFDDDSCDVLNSLFSSGIDYEFLQQENILQNRTLLSFTDPSKLSNFILKCHNTLKLVSEEAQRFSFLAYTRKLNLYREQIEQPVQSAKIVSDSKARAPDIIAGEPKLAKREYYFPLKSPFGQNMLLSNRYPLWYKIKNNNTVKVTYIENSKSHTLPTNKEIDYFTAGGSKKEGHFIISAIDSIIRIYKHGNNYFNFDMKYMPPKQV